MKTPSERDWLTELLNYKTLEQNADAWIMKERSGTLIVLNINNFKGFNEKYGHIVGDQLLYYIGNVLKKMFFGENMVGRISGDKFAVFLPFTLDEDEMERKCIQIQERFRVVQLQDYRVFRVMLTVCGCRYEFSWRFREMLFHAEEKIAQHRQRVQRIAAEQKKRQNREHITIDTKLIAGELQEEIPLPGAWCQDYETFKSIYRFTERRLKRIKSKVYIILFTLTDQKNEFLALEKRDRQVELLGRTIQSNLRMGDLYTQYTSCQFLVMISDTTSETAEMIAQRISGSYYEKREADAADTVLHHCYPLKPAVAVSGGARDGSE